MLTNAKPEIADYPFTTLSPIPGVMDTGDGRSVVIADIPGLIEGASEGVGLGHEFLRHIQRTKILLQLVDPMALDEGRNIIDLDYSATADYSYDINSLPELGRHSCNVISGTVEGYSFRENQTSSSYTGETVLRITVTGDAMNELEPGTQTELVLPGGYSSMRQHYGDTLYAEGGKFGDGIDMTEEEIDNTYYRYIFDNGEVPIVGKEYAFFVYDNGSGYGITGNNDSMLYKYDGVYIHKQDSGVLYLTMEDLKHMVKQCKDETAE